MDFHGRFPGRSEPRGAVAYMKLLTVLAATATAAAVAAAITIPAGADQGSADPAAAKLTSCLQAHGANAPDGSDPAALKQWLLAHQDDAAVKACNPSPDGLVSCLRSHGLNPPTSIFDLKPWMSQQLGTDAGKAALRACRVSLDPVQSDVSGQQLATCLRSHGADVPAGADGLPLKLWIRDHAGDPKAADALKACAGGPPGGKAAAAAKAAADGKAACAGGTAGPAPEAKPAPAASPDAATTQ
jgi:hypothetical protein